MTAKLQCVFSLLLCLVVKVQLENIGFSIGEESLAQFINRIGRLRSITALNIIHNRSTTNAVDLTAFLRELHQSENSYFALRPQITSNEKSRMQLFLNNDADALIITFARDVRDGILNVTTLIARGRRYCYTVFVFDCVRNHQELQSLFEYFWLKQIRRPLIIANRSQLYTMQPYQRELQVVNVTEAPAELYFPPANVWNYRHYKLRVPVQIDIPQTFLYPCGKHLWRLDGIGGTAFRKFMKHVNVSLEAYPLNEYGANFMNMTHLIQLLLDDGIEISPHLFTTLKPEKDIEYTYPYSMSTRCFMLSLNNELPRALYLLLPFQWPVWVSIVALIVMTDFGFRLWLKYIVHSQISRALYARISSGGVAFSALRIILAMSEPSFKVWNYRRASPLTLLRLCILCLVLTYLGIFISVSYSTMLTSLMTVTLFRKPTTSVADILKKDIPIMIMRQEEELIYDNDTLRHRFGRHIVYADVEEYHRNRYDMNRSYIYTISMMRWKFLNEQQRFLKRKRFWLSNICSGNFPLQYQLKFDSHFYRPFMYYILAIHEHGLLQHWMQTCFWKATKLGYVRYFKDTEADDNDFMEANVKGISLKLLTPVLYLYGVGVVLSLFSFLNELKYCLSTYLSKRCFGSL